MSFLDPINSKVIAALSDKSAAELRVWSTNHGNIFDLRLHSLHTCPFLAYMPAYFRLRKNAGKWAAWLHEFYQYKHREEDDCNCDQLLN